MKKPGEQLLGLSMGNHKDVIPLAEVPDRDLRIIIELLLEKQGLVIIREQTPDYTSYELC